MKSDTREALLSFINKYKNTKIGEKINNAEELFLTYKISTKLKIFLNIKDSKIHLSKRSAKHVLEKGKLGELLLLRIEPILSNIISVYESNHAVPEKKRYILVSKTKNDFHALILETNGVNMIVTMMIADIHYLDKKYKKLM